MRGKELFEKFTNIKAEYIVEVESETERVAGLKENKQREQVIFYRKWIPLVACIIGVLLIGPFVTELLIGNDESASTTSSVTEGTFEMATEESATEESASEFIEESNASEFIALYVDVETLPIYDVAVESECVLEDRSVLLETSLDNELEVIIYEVYCNSTSDEYLCTTTIHDMDILLEEEVMEIASELEWNLDAYVEDENLVQTAVVFVDTTWEETHGAIGGGTYEYIPEGRYEKYFILGIAEGSQEFQVYGVYQ